MSNRDSPADWGWSSSWPWILALTALSVVKTGYCVFCDNHATQLPLVFRLQNPTLFPDDPFLGAMEGYMGWVWWLVARLSEVVNLELLLGALFLLTRLLLVYGAGRLGAVLVPESKLAPVFSALLMALGPYPILGDGTLVEVYWEQSSMFMPLFVLALVLMLEDKPMRFCALFGIAYLINPLYGTWAVLFLGATYLVDPQRGDWKRFATASPLAILLAAPVFLGGVGVLSRPEVDMDLWMWVNRLLISPHAFPATWPTEWFWRFLLFSLLVMLVGWLARGRSARLPRLAPAWTLLGWLFLALAFVAATGVSRTLLIFQPARAAELFYLAGGIAAISVGVYQAETSTGPRSLLSMVAWISGILYLLVVEFREYASLASVLMGLALVTGLLWSQRRWRPDRRRLVAATAIWLVFAVGLTVSASLARRVKHEAGLARAIYRRPIPDMAELAAWARANTPIDAVFLHDPLRWKWAQFRYLAQRPVFVTWKDASAVLWDPEYAPEWTARFEAFGFRDELRDRWDLSKRNEVWRIRRQLIARYEELDDSAIREISEAYRLDYWIAPVETETGFPEVARAGEFKILALP